jgi:hypothetical protein
VCWQLFAAQSLTIAYSARHDDDDADSGAVVVGVIALDGASARPASEKGRVVRCVARHAPTPPA